MRKTRDAIFYAKQLPSGFYVLFCNGSKDWLDASLGSPDAVRKMVDLVAKQMRLTCYTLTFHEEEYKYCLANA